jgi:hypothetical protein
MAVSPAALCFFLRLRTAVLRCRFRTEPPVRQAVIHAIRRCFVDPAVPMTSLLLGRRQLAATARRTDTTVSASAGPFHRKTGK